MKKFNTFKIWFGKKLIDWGFDILLGMDERDWNPKKEKYIGSVKQTKYMIGSWFVTQGMRLESKNLNREGWPGYEETPYYIKNFHIYKNTKKKKKYGNDDLNNFFKGW